MKHKEFLLLKQGSITVRDYLTNKFMQLSRYVPRVVDEDKKKQDYFTEGLKTKIHYVLSPNDYPSFQRLIDRVL